MRPHLLKVPRAPEYSFSIRHDIVPYFYNHWHYHPEMELIYILRGSGTQFMGDHIGQFGPGDMILLGPNLTHMWRNDEVYFNKQSGLKSEAFVIHFLPDFLGPGFFKLSENKALDLLVEKAGQGMYITGNTREQVAELMKKTFYAQGTERIIYLLTILNMLAASKETTLMSSKGFHIIHGESETQKIDEIYQHVMRHFKEKISLKEIAAIANISPQSFCRYFKSRTRKTFSGFLMEVRISHACKLLKEEEISVSEVCYESGFNNVSNFNRYFKMHMGTTPLHYRKARLELQ
jgi:AraC-like DNA-binding protein